MLMRSEEDKPAVKPQPAASSLLHPRQSLQSSSSSSVNRDHNHVHGNRLLWQLSKIMYARHLTWYVYLKCSINVSITKRNAEEVPGMFESTGCSESLGALPPTRDLVGIQRRVSYLPPVFNSKLSEHLKINVKEHNCFRSHKSKHKPQQIHSIHKMYTF